MRNFKQIINPSQIKALLKKDIIVRIRQPWMTIIQFLWPLVIFISLYALRHRFQPKIIEDCQFPTRLLPAKNNLLPFFHSYVCSIENACQSTTPYEEYPAFEDAPLKPILNIVQTFLNEDKLYEALTQLPEKANFVSAVTTLATHSKFSYIRSNIEKVVEWMPKVQKMVGSDFDIKKLFSDSTMFSDSGKIMCGKPFPRNDNIRYVNNILYSEDFSEVNDDELDAMPTKYCKQLYLDVTSTNNGKMTWSQIKPVIQGKIIYGPFNNETSSIMKQANSTFEEFKNFQNLAESLNSVLVKIRTEENFKKSFLSLLELAKSPIVQMAVGDSVDINQIESVLNTTMYDERVADIVRTVKNILECFSVDRFIPVETEENLEETAFDLSKKKLFFAGIYFNKTEDKNVAYKFRMEPDNTPVTIETKNRFWFPGPEASMIEDMRYHRGFIQIKHAVDVAIIKHKKEQKWTAEMRTTEAPKVHKDEDDWFSDWDDEDDTPTAVEHETEQVHMEESTTSSITTEATSQLNNNLTTNTINVSTTTDRVDFNTTKDEERPNTRKKRQLDGLLGFLLGRTSSKKPSDNNFDVDKVVVHTKQFPYPRYTRDDFKRGLYLAQSVQMAFFMALIIQIATCIRYRIWMKESKNTMLMRSMGLQASSEILAWAITTFIEIAIIFVLACIILYSGGIMQHTGFVFILVFLFVFGLCIISFCYLCSNIFSSASIGSVSAAILFLMTFMPYIIIICLHTKLSSGLKFLTNLSLSTAFCYAWDHIMRLELQEKGLTVLEVFQGGLDSEFTYAFSMIVLDIILYAIVGYLVEYFKNDEFKFHTVPRKDLDISLGASLQNASVVYPQKKVAVSNISANFARNKVTCLLGRNGAGKSTIIKIITGQVKPTSGEVILSQALSVKKEFDQVGLCSQDNVLIPQLTAKEHLQMYAKIKLKENFSMEVMKTMKGLKFGKYENYEASKLSGGYQRRLCVAIAFIGSPNVVILDEPCSGVDTKARKCVWELIESLRKGRAVILATHHLDEAEYLSDSVLILNEGKIISKHNPQTLKDLFTKSFEVTVRPKYGKVDTMEQIKENLDKYVEGCKVLQSTEHELKFTVQYNSQNNKDTELFKYLEDLDKDGKIKDVSIHSKNLEEIFNNLNKDTAQTNGYSSQKFDKIDLDIKDDLMESELSTTEIVKTLLWKRFLHFRRNYRLLLCVLVLPIIFEVIAMGFMQLRPGGQYDTVLNLTRNLYPGTTEFLSLEKGSNFTKDTYKELDNQCKSCEHFDNSAEAFKWILDTHELFQGKRYGGLTFNESNAFVWYNNKGYHSMPAWLNDLNSHMLQVEMEDQSYGITTMNQPIKIGEKELSTSSILQQVADAGVSLIILIAFSLVVAGASVFIVNERVTGEKLQQKLCGIRFHMYWGVAFFWDFMVYLVALLLCVIVFKCFNISIYVDKSNLNGICLLVVLYGFACISGVHVFEKLFAEASFANMSIFCLNVVIPLATLTVVILFDILGDSDESERWRNFLNRAFLIFPQHALSDGLIEICKNYIISQVFLRYDIDSYKSPVSSDLLLPHYIALSVIGIIFIILNYLIESRIFCTYMKEILQKNELNYELKIVSIQNSLTQKDKHNTYSDCYALKVENLSKAYKGNDYAVKDVSFYVKTGECFGLLGKNGAGKSTIFKILSGQLFQTSGIVDYYNKEISYCPQISALDPLLTVREVIEFYGKLRRINNIPQLVSSSLKAFHLDAYKNVLVKNLSGGNRQKLNVAVSCLGNTSVVLMDEPTSDMDPVTRSLVYAAIKKLISEKRAVLLTSHTVSEIDLVCHRIGVLKGGRMINTGSPEELKEQYGSYYIVTVFPNKSGTSPLERDIQDSFPQCFDIQIHPNTAKFVVKVHSNSEMSVDRSDDELSLSSLLSKLKDFSTKYSVQYTLTKCRLDMIFEKILDCNENEYDGYYEHKAFETERDYHVAATEINHL